MSARTRFFETFERISLDLNLSIKNDVAKQYKEILIYYEKIKYSIMREVYAYVQIDLYLFCRNVFLVILHPTDNQKTNILIYDMSYKDNDKSKSSFICLFTLGLVEFETSES